MLFFCLDASSRFLYLKDCVSAIKLPVAVTWGDDVDLMCCDSQVGQYGGVHELHPMHIVRRQLLRCRLCPALRQLCPGAGGTCLWRFLMYTLPVLLSDSPQSGRILPRCLECANSSQSSCCLLLLVVLMVSHRNERLQSVSCGEVRC